MASLAAVWEPGDEAADRLEAERNAELRLALRARSDRAAFGQLYDRTVQMVFAFCLRRLGDREAAEDATSIVYTKALAAIGGFRDDSFSFRAWLVTIARNVVIDEMRARRQIVPLAGTDDKDEPSDSGVGPEALAMFSGELAELRALLGRLPVDQANILELRLAGLTDREIASVHGKRPGTIRVAQHRAIQTLRAIVERERNDHA